MVMYSATRCNKAVKSWSTGHRNNLLNSEATVAAFESSFHLLGFFFFLSFFVIRISLEIFVHTCQCSYGRHINPFVLIGVCVYPYKQLFKKHRSSIVFHEPGKSCSFCPSVPHNSVLCTWLKIITFLTTKCCYFSKLRRCW